MIPEDLRIAMSRRTRHTRSRALLVGWRSVAERQLGPHDMHMVPAGLREVPLVSKECSSSKESESVNEAGQ